MTGTLRWSKQNGPKYNKSTKQTLGRHGTEKQGSHICRSTDLTIKCWYLEIWDGTSEVCFLLVVFRGIKSCKNPRRRRISSTDSPHLSLRPDLLMSRLPLPNIVYRSWWCFVILVPNLQYYTTFFSFNNQKALTKTFAGWGGGQSPAYSTEIALFFVLQTKPFQDQRKTSQFPNFCGDSELQADRVDWRP